ncbi:MAG: hypothetical protein ACRC3Y_12325 [Romboutsia sp.]|uniref:hypothetical protein n=1 Tax=Romboutsia sp. TaxID=1965302 RepID=UPI003F3A73D6
MNRDDLEIININLLLLQKTRSTNTHIKLYIYKTKVCNIVVMNIKNISSKTSFELLTEYDISTNDKFKIQVNIVV